MRRLVTPPASEPISLEEAKSHLKVGHELEDDSILRMIRAARESAEEKTSRTLLPTTWKLKLARWPEPELLDGAWVREVLVNDALLGVVSISYRDLDGVLQVLDPAAYELDEGPPARIRPAYGTTWPASRPGLGSVEVVYEAGYATADDVPAGVKDWMLLHVGNAYENRESHVVGVSASRLPDVDSLLDVARWGGNL